MQQLSDIKCLILPVLERFKIKRAAIFGSVAKGYETTESDYHGISPATIYATIKQYLPILREQSEHLNDNNKF